MDDLLQPQIQESCRLAMPEGLKDLMSDISREVLRAQPKNLLQFITDYLSVLLVTRENLNAGVRVCDDICENMCAAGLEDELRYKGIADEDIKVVKDIVEKHLTQSSVKESLLISKIMRETSLSTEKIEDIQEAVRKAFVRNQAYNTTIYELSPDDSMDSITRAAQHTLDLYRKTKPADEEYNRAAEKIEAAYRAYGVRRQKVTEITKTDWFYSPEIMERAELEGTSEVDRKLENLKPQHISLNAGDNLNEETENHFADSHSVATNVSEKTEEIYDQYIHRPKLASESSYSLAGSFIDLPKHIPFHVQDLTIQESEETLDSITTNEKVEEEDESEKIKEEYFNVDYTKENSIVITEPITPILEEEQYEFESESSEQGPADIVDRKVVIDSHVQIHDTEDEGEHEEDIFEKIHELAIEVEERKLIDDQLRF